MARGNDESNNPKRRPKKRWDPFLQAWTSPPDGYDYAFNEDGTPAQNSKPVDDNADNWNPNGEEGPEGYGKDSKDPYK